MGKRLKVGDRVVITANLHGHKFKAGDEGVIYDDIKRGFNPHRFKRNDGEMGGNDFVTYEEVKVISRGGN